MPSITVKNIPEALHRQLRQRAKEHDRSINGEILFILRSVCRKTPQRLKGLEDRITALRNSMSGPVSEKLIDEAIETGRR
ncbi:MAG TPA: Arc family DNA-binding protein [Candidatus Ozemobacteraceae bacterium]|nr:Arc family DNA-binding protein [Candidatus Ozemobacteraceae bacterium]